jgi:anthranilate phosphoribosyltransferase
MKKAIVYAVAFSVSFVLGALASPIDGPLHASSVVAPNAVDSYNNIVLKGGERSSFLVDGDGDSDLDCFLLDSDGDVVVSDVDETDVCLLSVSPRRSDVYHLRIKNHGMANAYTLAVR